MSGNVSFSLPIHRLTQSDQIGTVWKLFDFHHLITAVGQQGGHQRNEDRFNLRITIAMGKKVQCELKSESTKQNWKTFQG